VRRIAYSPRLGAFALGCIDKNLQNNQEIVACSIKLVEELAFEPMGEAFELSRALEMVTTIFPAVLRDVNGVLVDRFLVGTSYLNDEDASARRALKAAAYSY